MRTGGLSDAEAAELFRFIFLFCAQEEGEESILMISVCFSIPFLVGDLYFFFWFPFNFRGRRSEKIPNKSNLFVFIGKKRDDCRTQESFPKDSRKNSKQSKFVAFLVILC